MVCVCVWAMSYLFVVPGFCSERLHAVCQINASAFVEKFFNVISTLQKKLWKPEECGQKKKDKGPLET